MINDRVFKFKECILVMDYFYEGKNIFCWVVLCIFIDWFLIFKSFLVFIFVCLIELVFGINLRKNIMYLYK